MENFYQNFVNGKYKKNTGQRFVNDKYKKYKTKLCE